METNHYPNEAGFLGAQNSTRFLSGKPTFNKFNFLTPVFKSTMPYIGRGQTARWRDAPCLGRTETYWLHDVQGRRAGQVVSTSAAAHPLGRKETRRLTHGHIGVAVVSQLPCAPLCITVMATQTSAALLHTLLRTMAQNHGGMHP